MTENISLTPSFDVMMRRAREISGIDRVDADAMEGLDVLLRSMREEAHLHAAGAAMLEERLLRILANRLRMQRDFAAHPEIRDEPIIEPVFICGFPRSGTTKLHKLLAATGDFNWLSFWQGFNPSLLTSDRTEPVAARIEDAERYSAWLNSASPELASGHSFEALEPEEETTLLEASLRSTSLVAWMDVPSFVKWALPSQFASSLEFLRDMLKYVQWQGLADSNRRWILKSINHFGMEDVLLRIFPDAKLLMPHRSPLQTLPSSCKLIDTFRRPFSHVPIRPHEIVGGLAMAVGRHLALRNAGIVQVLDFHYEDLIQAEDATIEKVYAFLAMTPGPDANGRIRRWNAENPAHKRGKFEYSLKQYGLSEGDIKAQFSEYFQRFITT